MQSVYFAHDNSYFHRVTEQKKYSKESYPEDKTILCNENGEYSMYKSDRYGFNNNDLEWDKNQIEYLKRLEFHNSVKNYQDYFF